MEWDTLGWTGELLCLYKVELDSLGDLVVALATIDVVSLQSQSLKGRDGLQHLLHIGWFHLCWEGWRLHGMQGGEGGHECVCVRVCVRACVCVCVCHEP